ncbi:hypothetical protein ACFOZ5_04970 [Marinobacter lacisalsi]|uniref:Uncharacterized protein n=1 Tax=Marinobacter lacisalsi TaxID=475979 RepID=A0ABV8QDE6_9GAMM
MKKNAYSVSVHSGARRTTNDHGNAFLHYFSAPKLPFIQGLPQWRASPHSREAVVALFWRARKKLASRLHSFSAADYQGDAASYQSCQHR